MASDRQKYNFLTALMRQVKEAGRDGDELYQEWCDTVRGVTADIPFDGGIPSEVADRLDAHAQWLAALEARLEDLEQAVELFACEEADDDDDGDDHEDVGGVQPRLGGNLQPERRVSPAVGGARDGQEPGRRVTVKRLVHNGT